MDIIIKNKEKLIIYKIRNITCKIFIKIKNKREQNELINIVIKYINKMKYKINNIHY